MKALVGNGVSVGGGVTTSGCTAVNTVSATNTRPGRALLRPGVLAFDGAIAECGLHAHQAVQVIAATSPLTVVDGSGDRLTGTHFVVPTDSPHRVTEGSAHGTRIYLDSETALGTEAGRRAHLHGWVHDPDELGITVSGAALGTQLGALTGRLLPENSRPADDPDGVVAAALRLLPGLVEQGAVRGADVADQVGTTTARLTHQFIDHVGIPLRRYIVWLRLHIIARGFAAHGDLDSAAHAAGFSGAAELTRTCKRAFGLTPAELTATRNWEFGGYPTSEV